MTTATKTRTRKTDATYDPRDVLKALPVTSDKRLAGFHGQHGTPLAAALRAIPGYDRTATAMAAYGPLITTAPRQQSASDIIGALVQETVAAGRTPTSADLWEEARSRTLEADARAAVELSIEEERRNTARTLDELLRSNLHRVVTEMDSMLRAVLDSTGDLLPTLDGVQGAAEAITQQKVVEYEALMELHREYVALREGAQHLHIQTNSGGPPPTMTNPLFYIADPRAVYDDYLPMRLRTKVKAADGSARFPRQAPWPVDWRSLDSLIWQAQNPGALPWLPTADQVDRATSLLNEYSREANHERNRNRAENWDAGFESPELRAALHQRLTAFRYEMTTERDA